MTDHLPECPIGGYKIDTEVPCICDRLLACEQRVLVHALQQAKAREANGITWQLAHERAFDAAEAAVAELAKETYCDSAPCWGAERYVAAIRGLREKP